jgi:membrane protease YdiL (CAAX protease family)
MSPATGSRYIIHFEDGETSEELGAEELRKMIGDGTVTVRDQVSKEGSAPSEYYLYDEFVDLWDLDDDDDDPLEVHTGDVRDDESDHLSGPFARTTLQGLSKRHNPMTPLSDDSSSMATEEDVEMAMPLPTISGTQSGLPFEAIGDDVDAAMSQVSSPGFEIEGFGDGTGAEDYEFKGYDALRDSMLDPITIYDLLIDSNLYSVLAVPSDMPDYLMNGAYLSRAEVTAQRQRDVARGDSKQVTAMEAARKLIFRAYDVLKDVKKRNEYDLDGKKRGGLQMAGAYLGLTPGSEADDLELGDVLPDFSEALDSLGADVEPVVEEEEDILDDLIADELGDEVDEGHLEALAKAEEAVLTSGAHGALPNESHGMTGGEAAVEEGPWVYGASYRSISEGDVSRFSVVGELFPEAAPDAARRRRDIEDRRVTTTLQAKAVRNKYMAAFTGATLDEEEAALVAQRPGVAIGQAIGLSLAVSLIALLGMLLSGGGHNELNLARASWWFYARLGLLIGAALVGTVVLRKNKIQRIGFWPSPGWSVIGVGLGLVAGILAAFIAPIRFEGAVAFTTVIGLMFFQAIAHEMFFRGYVTRMLLIDFTAKWKAIALSGLLYGLFYLTYYNVMQLDLFSKLYFSILVPGMILGSAFAFLYWKSKSIWPSTIAHFMILVLARVMGPGE